MKITEHFWALIHQGEIVVSRAISDGEEFVEIHRTRRVAEGARMAGEKIIKIAITHEM